MLKFYIYMLETIYGIWPTQLHYFYSIVSQSSMQFNT
jgi:hypothetical protein